jgi:hypothetical protein
VTAQDLIHVIFEDIYPIWLRTMWKDGGIAHADIIEILISLAGVSNLVLVIARTVVCIMFVQVPRSNPKRTVSV